MAGEGGGEEKTIAAGAGDTEEKSGEETTAALPKLPKKQACKRPAEDQQLQNAAAAKKRAQHSNRQRVGAPAPRPQGNGMQAPTRTLEYYARPLLPRPPVARNNGPAPQPALNGQVRVPRQLAAYNGQVPVAQQQVAFNGQVRPPPYRPVGTPNNRGQNQTVMTPPSCPASQGVNPPSAVPRMQKQPETDEMREKRVIQQNLEEYLWLQRQIYAAKQQWRMTFMQQPQQAMAFTQEQQQQAQAMAFTQQQQQAMAFTQQQQAQAMAFTQQQQQATAFGRQQQQPTAYAPQLQQYRQQQQQQYHQQLPYLGGASANYHHQAGGVVPRFSLDDFYASNAAQYYERSPMVLPAASGSLGEAVRVTAEALPVSTVVSVEGDGDHGSHGQQEPARASAEGDGSQHA
ncbi:hypothetical protein CFC21_093609 [Triticum aestivum]|uniref:Uncharacterized protein n=2 Tax=Triticum aestivum TaxID=4565 RepID=A0A9R1LLB0_WHEAT|nr:putative uncharacterized protein DDB_G0271606 [Aegilops tauschii subsp. strangulata]KAF7090931.1 hypothetical protein CFC21_093609 [Triticum aestivum]